MLKERDYLEREKELLNENKSLKTQINNLQKQNLKLKINFKEKGKGKQIRVGISFWMVDWFGMSVG